MGAREEIDRAHELLDEADIARNAKGRVILPERIRILLRLTQGARGERDAAQDKAHFASAEEMASLNQRLVEARAEIDRLRATIRRERLDNSWHGGSCKSARQDKTGKTLLEICEEAEHNQPHMHYKHAACLRPIVELVRDLTLNVIDPHACREGIRLSALVLRSCDEMLGGE